ncbi:hypothetical protein NG796_15885 [Laspinema sp. A4]|uniref:hypothetical protein n=1 Tax=Laspinema sp. D2d TaxID=2953686 RepID=UPI0021BAE5E5|nr:hypothetical protein [Laspinema sp. D2d]MCT7984755.1 hypothetical protein [Laspinema sp. D2d]
MQGRSPPKPEPLDPAIALILPFPEYPVQSPVSLKLVLGFRGIERRSLLNQVHPPGIKISLALDNLSPILTQWIDDRTVPC